MKKLSVFVVGALCMFAFTANASLIILPPESAITAMNGFDQWLNAPGNGAADYINSNGAEAAKQALAWDKNAHFSSFNISYPAKSCTFTFVSLQRLDQVFKASCVDLTTQKMVGQAVPATGVEALGTFGYIGMNLRTFVSEFLASKYFTQDIRDYMHGTSTGSVDITLSMNKGSDVQWTWQIGTTDPKLWMKIYADAMHADSPVREMEK